jgi:hypothetical protein
MTLLAYSNTYCKGGIAGFAGSPEAPCLAPKLVPRLLNAGFGPADDGYKRKTPAKVYAVLFFIFFEDERALTMEVHHADC